MAGSKNQKLKMLYVLRFLKENTDEEQGITMKELISYLDENDIKAERKSLYTDFEALRGLGYDIISQREGNSYYYKLASREFELAELKIIVDTIDSSSFITSKKKRELLDKISTLTSVNQAKQLKRQTYISDKGLKDNKHVLYSVDAIHKAINGDKKILFKYFCYNENKEKVLRGNGATFSVSPYYLVVNEEKYYLLAYNDYSKSIRTYRVDRMQNVRVAAIKRVGKAEASEIEISDYMTKMFSMFGGEETSVKLRCDNSLAEVILDKFGYDTQLVKYDKKRFETIVKLMPSKKFFGFIFSNTRDIEIVEPKSVRDQMTIMLNSYKL